MTEQPARRVVVQGDGPVHLFSGHPYRKHWTKYRGREPIPAGTVSWAEHCEAWRAYAKRFGEAQSAERIVQRGGFSYLELVDLLGREPDTWSPR